MSEGRLGFQRERSILGEAGPERVRQGFLEMRLDLEGLEFYAETFGFYL